MSDSTVPQPPGGALPPDGPFTPPPAPAPPAPSGAAKRPPPVDPNDAATARALKRLPTLVAVLGVTVVAVVLYSQQRSINELTADIDHLKSAQTQIFSAMAGRGGTPVVIDVTGAPALGPAQAIVTMVEFSDYECPFCIRHFMNTMPLIRSNYIDTGKIRYVFKDFPVDSNHPMAIRAHEAAHCAGEQNKFWSIHTRLFSAPGTHNPDQLNARAAEAGLDPTAFKACIASGRTTAAIRESVALAGRLGADGTPAFFLGIRDTQTEQVRVLKTITGAQDFPTFQSALDELIAAAR